MYSIRPRRFVAEIMIVAALMMGVATASPALAAPPDAGIQARQQYSAIPSILVGTWSSGSKQTDFKVTFTGDGRLRLDLNNGTSEVGTVAVRGSSMAWYFRNGTHQFRNWSVTRLSIPEYGYAAWQLAIDGIVFVRDSVGR